MALFFIILAIYFRLKVNMKISKSISETVSYLNFQFTTKSFLIIMGIIGVLLVVFYGLVDPNLFLVKTSQSLLIGFASMMVGVFVGFLFGIPKSISKNLDSSSGTYTSNTNLEEISDWLTKILVGLGLTQISFIPPKFESIVLYLYLRMSSVPANVIASVLIYFVFYGFFVGYLATRLYLAKEFARTEQDLQELKKNIAQVDMIKGREFVVDKSEHSLPNQVWNAEEVASSTSINDVIANIISQTRKVEDSGGSISSDQYFQQGRIMLLNRSFPFAKEYFLKSYSIDRNYKAGSNAAVVCSKYLNEYSVAETLLKQLVSDNPQNPLAYYNLACNYVRLKDYDKAINSLTKALELGGDDYKDQAREDDTFIQISDIPAFKNLVDGYKF
jgi:hypothetical protein